jgi:hypothetical protein
MNKNFARMLLLLCAIVVAGVPLTAAALRSRLRPVRSLKAHFLGGSLLPDQGVELQQGPADCGPAALRIVFALRGVRVSDETRPVNRGRAGWSVSQIVAASREAGMEAARARIPPAGIATMPLPAIALLGTHYVVIERRAPGGHFIVVDPGLGRMKAGIDYLIRDWTGHVVIFPGNDRISIFAPVRLNLTDTSGAPRVMQQNQPQGVSIA